MPTIGRIIGSAVMGACMGGGGVIASGLISAGRMPPKNQIGGAAGFMAFMLGVGSVVRGG